MQLRKYNILSIVGIFGLLILLNSCKKEYETIQSIDEAKIQTYIKANNLVMTKDPSGFYYQVLSQGTGAPLLYKDSIFYSLNVKSLAGTTYYTTPTYSSEATYFGYIYPDAYRTALTGVNRGGKVRVILPSYLAYGKNGTGNVPSNEVIVSEISTYPNTTQWSLDDKFIADFLLANNLNAIKDPSRVYSITKVLGTGSSIELTSTITVKYTGRLLNGTVFQTSGNDTITEKLANLIPGWQKVLVGKTNGTKIRIFVPSDLAYGLTAQTGIPARSVLDFDIEVTDVVN